MTVKEKRHYQRIVVDYVTVEVYSSMAKLADELDIVDICSVINLSENGMLFSADHPFTKGQLLRLTFNLPHSMVIIRTDALVIHVLKMKGMDEVGVQFTHLGISEQKLIQHFVNKMLCPSSD
jgi:hypothetical protein